MKCPHCQGLTGVGEVHGAGACVPAANYRLAAPKKKRAPDIKRCPRCKEEKPRTAEFFYFSSDGHVAGACRACRRERNAEKSTTPLKRAAHHFGCAKNGSQEEKTWRAEVIRLVKDEAAP